MPALCGVRVLLDAASARALEPWLDVDAPNDALSIVVEIQVAASGSSVIPAVAVLLLSEPRMWLGRTGTGLVIGDRFGSWFAIEGSPPALRGELAPTSANGAPEPPAALRAALFLALGESGVHALHAATVCSADRAFVLLGNSGAGKSTTATALVSAGCRYLGDDGLLLRNNSDGVELFGYSPSFRLTDEVAAYFPGLSAYLLKTDTDDKWLLDCASAFPDRYIAHWSGATSLLFLTRTTEQRSLLSTLSLAEATSLLIEQSNALGLDSHPNPRHHLDMLAQLANRSHVALLQLGSEWLREPAAAARRLLERAGAFAPMRAGVRREAS